MTNQLQQYNQHPRRTVDVRIPAIEKYAYCLCLHVKPTTIFIAVFKLIRALLFASILLNTEFTIDERSTVASGLNLTLDSHKSTAVAVSIFTRIIMASVSALGIYAVISARAALLMPLYAILLVDFFFALPAFYGRDLDPSSLGESLPEYKSLYPPNSNQYTRYSLMLFSTITMVVKIYFLCVIWKCYRYLRLIELVSPIRLSEIYPHVHQGNSQYPVIRVLGSSDTTDLGTAHSMAPPPYESLSSSMKPPNYEEAMKSPCINYSTTNPAVSQNQQQQLQQTVVITNPELTEQHQRQNISTQVITGVNSANRPLPDGLISDNSIVINTASEITPADNQGCHHNPTISGDDNKLTNSSTEDRADLVRTDVSAKLESHENRDTT